MGRFSIQDGNRQISETLQKGWNFLGMYTGKKVSSKEKRHIEDCRKQKGVQKDTV